jgi:hypothetical protein
MAVTFTAGTVMAMLALILGGQLYTARKVPSNEERSRQNRAEIEANTADIEAVEETAEEALETAEDVQKTVAGGASA